MTERTPNISVWQPIGEAEKMNLNTDCASEKAETLNVVKSRLDHLANWP
jgi:hypothetical protein